MQQITALSASKSGSTDYQSQTALISVQISNLKARQPSGTTGTTVPVLYCLQINFAKK